MKKTISCLLVFFMLFTCLPVFAEEGAANNAAGESTAAEAVAEEETVPAAEVEELIKIDGEEALIADENKIIDELDTDQQITSVNIVKVLRNIYKYLVKRDLYYQKILRVMERVKNSKNKALVKKAIIEFEKRYERQKETDRKIHHKIKKILIFLKENKAKLSAREKLLINKVLKPALRKYSKHRKMVIYIHTTIQQIKEANLADDVRNLAAQAEQYQKKGDKKKAAELYEKAIAKGVADQATLKKAGVLLAQVEGKGPKVFVKGARPDFDVKPMVKNGRTLVPLRAIADALNAKTGWDQKTNTVTITKGDTTVELPIDKKFIKINGQTKAVDAPATIVNKRTLVPVRVVSETLDANVTYDPETEVITIEDNFTSENQNIKASEITDTGLGSGEEYVPDTTEEEVVDEVNSVDETTVQQDIDSIEEQQ